MDYDKSKYKIWNWKNILVMHWLINPGLALNELIFGQRVPKVMLIEKDAVGGLLDIQKKTKVPCPHCGMLHSGLKWSTQNNALKNWFGLYCDNCGKIIPCVRNLTSMLLLAVTFPIWIWFKDAWKQKWLKVQPDRYKNLDLEHVPNPYEGYGWIREGLSWALFMYVFMEILFPLIFREDYSLRSALIGVPVCIIGGLVFGLIMKISYGKSQTKTQTS